MDQGSSNKMWYVVVAIVVIALALWYYLGRPSVSTPSAGDTTAAAITSEFGQIPDDSAALDQDAVVSAEAVQGF